MTRKLTIRSKLAAALAIPLVGVAAAVIRQVADAQGSTEADPTVVIAAGGGVVFFTLFILWLANRMITRPLRALADEAQAMANERLADAVASVLASEPDEDFTPPELDPIAVHGGAEITGVVDALNAVQASALELAVEQALLRRTVSDSFVNLGRRNQNLLARQLELISKLETDETDAKTLEALFQLDHLATRMRRNAESLLVLAGEEPPRQWTKPVHIGDVVRAAMGEVEQYHRVRIHPGSDDTTIAGRAVTDISHLLAELLENALTFSPPTSNVDLYARHGDDGYFLVTINDDGIGMQPDDMERANARLATPEVFTIAPSRYLGYFVVANLAARHRVRVQLATAPSGGVTVSVWLPPTLLADGVVTTAAASLPPVEALVVDEVVQPEAATIVIPEPAPVVFEPEPAPVVYQTEPVAYVAELEPEPVAYEPPPAPEPEPEPVPEPQAEAEPVQTMSARGAFAALLFERPRASEAKEAADAIPNTPDESEPSFDDAESEGEPEAQPVEAAAAAVGADDLAATLAQAAPIYDDLLPRYEAPVAKQRGRRGRKGPRVAEVPDQVMRIAAAAPAPPPPLPAPIEPTPTAMLAPASNFEMPTPGTPAPEPIPAYAPMNAFGELAAVAEAPALPRRGHTNSGRQSVPEPVAAPEEDAPAEAAETSRNYALFAAFRAATDLGRADAGQGGGS